MKKRRVSKQIQSGNVKVGGDAPVSVQSMTKTDTRDVKATVAQIRGLEEAGCDIIRCAVPDLEAAKAALAEGRSILDVVVEKVSLSQEQAEALLQPGRMAEGGLPEKE